MSKKSKPFKTGRGVALYPVLERSDTFKGKPTGRQTLQLVLTGKSLKDAQAEVEEFITDTYSPKEAKAATRPFKLTKLKDGEEQQTYIKFSCALKDDEGKTRHVKVFNAKGDLVKNGREIARNLGSGSVIRVNGVMAPGQDGPGVFCYMNSIQIIKYVEYTPGGGFDAVDDEDGWTGDEFDGEEEDEDAADGEDADEEDEPEEKPAKAGRKGSSSKRRDF